MKYVVPLFHPDSGRTGLGPQNWDAFQHGFGIVIRDGRFAGVVWNSSWRPRVISERRTIDRRTSTDRRKHSDEVRVRPYGPDQMYQRRREGQRRRLGGRNRKDGERRINTHPDTFLRLADFAQELRKKHELSRSDLELLVAAFSDLSSGKTYALWRESQIINSIFEEPKWSKSDLQEKFRDYAVACCLDLLRPGSVGWHGPSPNVRHMETVAQFASLFPLPPPGSRRKAIRDFFDGRADLTQAVKTLKPDRLPYPKKALLAIWANRHLPPTAFYEAMRDQLKQYRIRLSSNPESYRKQIQRLKEAAEKEVWRWKEFQA